MQLCHNVAGNVAVILLKDKETQSKCWEMLLKKVAEILLKHESI